MLFIETVFVAVVVIRFDQQQQQKNNFENNNNDEKKGSWSNAWSLLLHFTHSSILVLFFSWYVYFNFIYFVCMSVWMCCIEVTSALQSVQCLQFITLCPSWIVCIYYVVFMVVVAAMAVMAVAAPPTTQY